MNATHAPPLLNREKLLLTPKARDWRHPPAFLLVYPNLYGVGMTNLGFQFLLGEMLASRTETFDRAFPLTTGGTTLFPRPTNKVPRSLVGKLPWTDFPVHMVSLSFETDQLHYLRGLRDTGIPLRPNARTERDPLVVVGGAGVSANPCVALAWADAAVCGEGELVFQELCDALIPWCSGGLSRWETLDALREIPGVWTATEVRQERVLYPPRVDSLDVAPIRTVIQGEERVFAASVLCELSRGCGRSCRFCLVKFGCGPVRHLSLAAFRKLLADCPTEVQTTFGLVGASLADNPELHGILKELHDRDLGFSTSSLRLDRLSLEVLDLLAAGRSRTLTFAPEAGTERLRQAIGKPLSNKRLWDSLQRVAAVGHWEVKLYFMIGLPTETDQDVDAVLELLREAQAIFRKAGRPGALKVGVAPFVPKPWTPFQWAPFPPLSTLAEKLRRLREGAVRLGVRLTSESARAAEVEAVLAMGGSPTGRALVEFVAAEKREPGAAAFRRAMGSQKGPLATLRKERDADTAFPWDRLNLGVAKGELRRLYERARQAGISRSGRP
jgi:radical SAM superfamily enzyme YgiQ (UPF0313 family)